MKELVKKALEAQKFSYSPYSNFQVGVALLSKSGKIYTGCNIENAAFSPTNCAERTAFFKAVSEGELQFEAIAIVGSRKGAKEDEREYCAPCGVCRQVMAEFCNIKDFKVILGKSEDDYKVYTLEEILPLAFTKDDL
mgnify:FL=1